MVLFVLIEILLYMISFVHANSCREEKRDVLRKKKAGNKKEGGDSK